MTDNEKRFRQKVEKLTKVYVAKNKDYGDSFSQSLDKYGIIASLVRMGDKMNRIDSLYDKPTTEVDESLVDSLEDLANYAIMTAIWLEKQADDIRKHVRHWDDDFDDDYDDLFDDDIERELDWNDGWHEFDDNDFEDEDDDDNDDIDAFLDMLSNFDSEDDDVERELDWNDGWHEFDDNDFDDDESEDDPEDFSMDGKPKFRIRRRLKGGISDGYWWM